MAEETQDARFPYCVSGLEEVGSGRGMKGWRQGSGGVIIGGASDTNV